MTNVFIIGSKGIPARYGGFETFVENLIKNKSSRDIKYHVSCLAKTAAEFEYHQARCFSVIVKNLGSARAVLYDLASLCQCMRYIRKNNLHDSIIYILACRIGPFIGFYKWLLQKMNVNIFVNPDGHEWKRGKWNRYIKAYWKYSEKLMVKHADLLICDAVAIKEYIAAEYSQYHPRTVHIAYGTVTGSLNETAGKAADWYAAHELHPGGYYLVVGRFVPENNYEIIIREFMNSKSKRDLVFITNLEENKFYRKLLKNTGFNTDNRIKFVGTVYEEGLLQKIREDSFAYIHGHEVGGTNPSLLEAMGSTQLNILLDVSFNKEVGRDSAIYFTKEKGSLARVVGDVELYSKDQIVKLGKKAKQRIYENYSWGKIVTEYEDLFLGKENRDSFLPLEQIV